MITGAGRFDYVKYDELALRDQEVFKTRFVELAEVVEVGLMDGRAKSLVLTKLEEAYMWVGKSIRDRQVARNGRAELQEERCLS